MRLLLVGFKPYIISRDKRNVGISVNVIKFSFYNIAILYKFLKYSQHNKKSVLWKLPFEMIYLDIYCCLSVLYWLQKSTTELPCSLLNTAFLFVCFSQIFLYFSTLKRTLSPGAQSSKSLNVCSNICETTRCVYDFWDILSPSHPMTI